MRRPTIILLIVFALLGALVWNLQQPDSALKKALATSTTVAAVSMDNLVNPALGPLSRLSIKDASGTTVSIDKSSGQWQIETGGQTQTVNQDEAEAQAGQALNLRVISKLDPAPDAAGTGLKTPAYSLTLTLADGSITNVIIGNVTVTGIGYYAQTADGNVYIARKSEVDALIGYFKKPSDTAPAATQIP